ncbi:MAG: class I adenylate-forming enzyme family protein [Acutalibacteraceae bacterium]|nr:class I adenylate-forming enzyme family protein [Acutalibacteraceae bacterium]
MIPAPNNLNCVEYLEYCTSRFDDVYMMQHFGVNYLRSEVLRDINRLAAYFQKGLGLKKGDVYTIFMPTTMQSIIAFYALNKIGVITSFVHPLMGTDYLTEQLELVHSKGVMVLDILLAKGKTHIEAINKLGIPCLVCSSSDYSEGFKKAGCKFGESIVKKLLVSKFTNYTSFKDAMKMHSNPEVVSNNADDVAVYLNGGGTTGKSKTIKLTSRAINELSWRVSDIDEIHDPGNECEVIVLPLFHCFGLCLAVHMAMCNSACIIPMMQFDAKIFTKLMRKYNVVGFGGIPLMFQKLMKDKHFDGPHLSRVRLMFCGGDDISDGFIDEFNSYFEKWGATGRLLQGYGLTEIGSVCTTNTGTEHKRGSIGKPIRGVTVQIWDDDHKEVPDGTVGEFVISGPTIMQGYYMEGEAEDYGLYTDENGTKWVLSGDLGYKDEEGFFHFSGRKKRLIIIAGYNVYPTDIERVVGEFSEINECCAVQGWDNGRSMVRLYASLNEKNTDTEALKAKISETLEKEFSKFYVPRDFVFMDELPQTPLMKIDFMKLTEADPEKARAEGKIS